MDWITQINVDCYPQILNSKISECYEQYLKRGRGNGMATVDIGDNIYVFVFKTGNSRTGEVKYKCEAKYIYKKEDGLWVILEIIKKYKRGKFTYEYLEDAEIIHFPLFHLNKVNKSDFD